MRIFEIDSTNFGGYIIFSKQGRWGGCTFVYLFFSCVTPLACIFFQCIQEKHYTCRVLFQAHTFRFATGKINISDIFFSSPNLQVIFTRVK